MIDCQRQFATSILAAVLAAGSLTVLAGLYGCASSSDAGRSSNGLIDSVDDEDGTPVATVVDARPAALVNGKAVRWGELRPLLTEAAGAEALQDIIFARMIDERLASAGITITEDDLNAEQELLLESLHEDSDTAIRLLNELRRRQGLGPTRFRMLLYRNAALRCLVRDQVQIDEDAERRMFEYLHGEKRQPRLITVPNLTSAQRVLERLEGGEPFGDVAVNVSTDASANRGGLLEPISRVDASYPRPIREALWQMSPGDVTSPILLDSGYVILRLDRIVPDHDVAFADVRDEVRRLARINRERSLMEQLGRRILSDTSVTVFDESLDASWSRRSRWQAE